MKAFRITLLVLSMGLLLAGCPKTGQPSDAATGAKDTTNDVLDPASLDTIDGGDGDSHEVESDGFDGDVPMTRQEDLYMPVYDDVVGC